MSAFYKNLVGNRGLLSIGGIAAAAAAVSGQFIYAQQHDAMTANFSPSKLSLRNAGDSRGSGNSGNSDESALRKMRNLLFFGAPALKKKKGTTDAEEYQAIYNAIALKLREEDEYDDAIGYGPVLVRLAWHVSGTWDKSNNSGGSYGGTYRFSKEAGDPANKGLENAASFLRPIHAIFPWLSHGDLYTLGGIVAIQEMQGPKIPWRPGRVDQPEEKTPDNGRLPDANQDANYVRDFFKRLDLNDREVVALLGAHALGKTHLHNSGFEGPWGAAKNVFSNEFFVNLLNEEWKLETNPAGNKQYNNDKGWMMLRTDYALVQDSDYHKLVKEYAADEGKFFEDFKAAFSKLLESGVSFPKSTPKFYFKTLDEQDI